MNAAAYQIGQSMPYDPGRRPLGASCEETWYILIATPQRDKALAAWLSCIGALEAWTPSETRWRNNARGKRRRVEYERLIAPGYVFTLLDRAPVWDVLRDHAGKRLRGVVGLDERPLSIAPDQIAAMRQVPKRIESIRAAKRAQLAAIREKHRARAGERATLLSGPMAGFVVDVTEIHQGVAHFVMQGIKGTVAVDDLRRGGES